MSSTESYSANTIYALATAAGKSGVAVIRISGPQALTALKLLTQSAISARRAHYVAFSTPVSNELIDRGLALYFPGPHSFTGEEVVECHLHGSHAVIRQMLETLGQVEGLRPAEAGEFTRRAFLNGKMDLMEAEGLADLIDAQTSQQKSQALRQMQGEMSAAYEKLRVGIIESLALLEAYIDFPDEEIPESVLTSLEAAIMGLRSDIAAMLSDHRRGERLRDGINVVILGAPNAGKSSLLNAIAKRDVVIVSHKPGTTRDMVEIHVDIAGYPVVFVDTAGLRDSEDDIEAEGIRRALARSQSADIKLVLFDGTQAQLDATSQSLLDDQSMAVITKCDLLPVGSRLTLLEEAHYLSTKTGEGVDALLNHIEKRIINDYAGNHAPFITRTRHRAFLEDSLKHLEKSSAKLDLELRCEELRLAALALGKITGKIQVDDVLDVIFKRFCIGK
jgi:tRNA modification GTPase